MSSVGELTGLRRSGRVGVARPSRYALLPDPSPKRSRTKSKSRNARVPGTNVAECYNCHRRHLPLRSCLRTSVQGGGRLYINFSVMTIERGGCCSLCDECHEVVTSTDENRIPEDWRYCWPSFMWTFLTDSSEESVVSKCGAFEAWKFVPGRWRKWWLESLVEWHPSRWMTVTPSGVRLKDAVPHFEDVTEDLRSFECMLENLKLGEIRRVCNKLNFPTVYCPWGCSTFLQDVGGLNIASVFHHLLRKRRVKVRLSGPARHATQNCVSIRPDYIDPDHPRHLVWSELKVRPCIGFHRKLGMSILTCKCHSGGTLNRYYHVPRSPTGLPSALGDQLAHCVVHHRTIKPMKPKVFNNTYQLFMQSGSFNGIDLSCVKTNGDFRARSELLAQTEAISIACRDDIRGLLGVLQDEGIMHEQTAESYRQESAKRFPDGGEAYRLKYASGTTYTLYTDCMKLQRELATVHQITITLWVQNRLRKLTFRPLWARSIVYVHPADSYGAVFAAVSGYRMPFGSSLLSCLVALATTVPQVWDELACGITTSDDWAGTFLVFASIKGLPYHRCPKAHKNDPFKAAREMKWEKMMEKLKIGAASQSCKLLSLVEAAMSPQVLATWNCVAGMPRGGSAPFSFGHVRVTHKLFMCAKQRESRSRSALPDSFTVEEGGRTAIFELRFFFCGNSDSKGDFHTIFARHGRPFTSWFMTSVREREFLYATAGEVLSASERWLFAAYVNVSPPDVEELRKEFLSYIGGQAVAFCADHRVPLIVVGTKSVRETERCPGVGDTCGRKIYYKCPRNGCRKCLCQKCLASIPAANPVFLSKDAIVVDAPKGADEGDDNHDDNDEEIRPPTWAGEDDGADSLGVNEDWEEEEQVYEGEESNFDTVTGAGEEADDDEEEVMPFMQGLHDGTDEPLFDPEAGDTDTGLMCPEIPQTVAHANAICSLENDPRSDFVGRVCLLNGLGSMLVRTRHDVNPARAHLEFLQRRAVNNYGKAIPLLYLESTLHPGIFMFDDGETASVLGAIPSAFLGQEKNTKQHGIASYLDHTRNRVQLADSATGTDFRYQTFMFDGLLNRTLSKEDTRVVLNRGVASSNTPAGLRVRSKDDHFFSDSIDNRENVLNLTESQKYYRSNYFITITANQKKMFGLSPIKDYIDGDKWIAAIEKIVGRPLRAEELQEYRVAIHDASCTLMTRCWLKIRYIIMAYIMDSAEKPLGQILTIFWRDEYQDGEGNLPHIHGLVQTLYDKTNPVEVHDFLDRIRGFGADIVRVDEINDFVYRGILDSKDDWVHMCEDARRILTHRDRRNEKRSGTGDGEVKQRNVDPVFLTPDPTKHTTIRVDPGHKPEAIQILARCGLCDTPPDWMPSQFSGEHEILQCLRFLPPVRRFEHNMSPVVGGLFAATRSMMNVQIVAGYTIARYVTKYLIKVDKNSHTVCHVNPRDEGRVRAHNTFLYNTKIASSNHFEKKRMERRRIRDHPQGRVIARTEIVQLLVGDPQVHHNQEFVKIVTTPLEDRAGIKKRPETETREEDDWRKLRSYHTMAGNNTLSFVIYPDYVRRIQGLPQWRQFTPNQVMVIDDNFDSEVTVSKVTVFCVRPPELRALFPFLLSYFRWFTRVRIHKVKEEDELMQVIKPTLRESEWIDGFGFTVRLREEALGEVEEYLGSIGTVLAQQPDQEIIDLFRDLVRGSRRASMGRRPVRNWSALRQRYIRGNAAEDNCWNRNKRSLLPIPVHSFVKPTNATKFLYHILLCFGQFETELDLIAHPTVRAAFQAANLIDDTSPESLEQSITELICRFVVEQLAYYPVGTRTWDNYLIYAATVFEEAILRNTIPIHEMPACLYTHIQTQATDKLKLRLADLREASLRAAYNELEISLRELPDAPTLDDLLAPDRSFNLTLVRSRSQSNDSFLEQHRVRQMIDATLEEYCDPRRRTLAKSLMISGGPGNGKTHCLMYSVLAFYARKRIIVPCAVLADRALAIGGIHFHILFHFPVSPGTAQRLAELAVVHILRKPESLELLLRIDGLALDESGTMSACIFSALDIIMRRVRGVETWMGGMIIVTTIDDKQLKPVDGYPLLLSPNILTCFRVAVLKHSVRSAEDQNQQRIIEISRMPERTLADNLHYIDEVIDIVGNNCQFVPSWDHPSITNNTLRVFAKKQPAMDSVEEFYRRIEREFSSSSQPGALGRRKAEDVERPIESHARYEKASTAVVSMLNKSTKEAQELLFFPYAVFLFTYNDPKKQFTQSRLGLLIDVPDQADLDAFRPIRLLAAPPGVRSAPVEHCSRERLLRDGWTEVRIGPAPEYKQTYAGVGLTAKRKQYGLRPFISSTIHSIQGATLRALATSIAAHKDELRLWEKAQWVVLISRTRFLRDVIFVGDKEKTLDMIREILMIRSQFAQYIEHVLNVAAGVPSESPTLLRTLYPYRPRDSKLPDAACGFCYLLVDSMSWAITYIGQTMDLPRRVRDHNSGNGARETRGRGPWLLAAYVVGFDGDETAMREFENDWQNLSRSRFDFARRSNHGSASMATILNGARSLIASGNSNYARSYTRLDLRLEIHADIELNVED